MKLYDDVILAWNELLKKYSDQARFFENSSSQWQDIGKKNMVLRSEMAYELGGNESQLFAIGGTAITSNEDFVKQDEIVLYGKDLTEISSELPYARLTICRVTSDSMGEGEKLYKAIKNIEYCRYHVNPEGFMTRVSSLQNRESVRVSKEAIQKGISFSDVGSLSLKSLHKDEKVIAAKIIFINLPDFPYTELEELVKKADDITKTIDHIASNALMDCNTCGLQKICDEVEGMKELHFGSKSGNTDY